MKLLLGLPEFTSGFDVNARSWPFGRLPALSCSGSRVRAVARERLRRGTEEGRMAVGGASFALPKRCNERGGPGGARLASLRAPTPCR
ncbi:hypothetical protein DF034_32295 [Burkholderia anthina]|nr:hypothetical protein DF034_32295 [Burkholderia anthina]